MFQLTFICSKSIIQTLTRQEICFAVGWKQPLKKSLQKGDSNNLAKLLKPSVVELIFGKVVGYWL